MKVNIAHLVIGRIKIGRKVFDLFNLQIRDELSSESIRKYAIECAEKIKLDPRFSGDELKIEIFYRDLLESVAFFPVEPRLVDTASITIFKAKAKAIITIPNDYKPEEAKGSTFHETIHFLGKYTNNILFSDENLVDSMVDSYLYDDKGALFERRWLQYSCKPKINLVRTVTSMIIFFIIGTELGKGYLSVAVIILIGYIACYKLFKRIKLKSIVHESFDAKRINFKIGV